MPLDAQLDALGRAAMEALEPATGERVIDVGCSCDQSLLELAERVGPGGRILGVDVSARMLERARSRVRDSGHEHVELVEADVQTHDFPAAEADAVFSRFGVMFFDDPPAAFGNLASALRRGGRIAFVCWQALQRNPWMHVPMAAAAEHVPMPPPPPPGAPGPFAFAAADRLLALLDSAGLAAVRVDPYETTIAVGGTTDLDAATEFVLRWLRIEVDGVPAIVPFSEPYPVNRVEVELAGWLHRLTIAAPIAAARVWAVSLQPLAAAGAPAAARDGQARSRMDSLRAGG